LPLTENEAELPCCGFTATFNANGMDMAQEIESKFLASGIGPAPRQREKTRELAEEHI
jgi:hypothetical protein